MCVCEVSWCEEAGAQERRDRVASHVFSTTMSSAQFHKAVVPHSSNMFLGPATSMRAGNETTFVASHDLGKAYG